MGEGRPLGGERVCLMNNVAFPLEAETHRPRALKKVLSNVLGLLRVGYAGGLLHDHLFSQAAVEGVPEI